MTTKVRYLHGVGLVFTMVDPNHGQNFTRLDPDPDAFVDRMHTVEE